MNRETCENCTYFYDPKNYIIGEQCVRFPPDADGRRSKVRAFTIACGEFKHIAKNKTV